MRILLAFFVCSSLALAAEHGALRAGAARVDITPPANPAYPPSGKYAHERLYVRAIVLDNGATRAALIGADQGNLPEEVWRLDHAAGRLEADEYLPHAARSAYPRVRPLAGTFVPAWSPSRSRREFLAECQRCGVK